MQFLPVINFICAIIKPAEWDFTKCFIADPVIKHSVILKPCSTRPYYLGQKLFDIILQLAFISYLLSVIPLTNALLSILHFLQFRTELYYNLSPSPYLLLLYKSFWSNCLVLCLNLISFATLQFCLLVCWFIRAYLMCHMIFPRVTLVALRYFPYLYNCLSPMISNE